MTASSALTTAVLNSAALKRVVKSPSAVANALDWRKASGGVATALAIDIHADQLGLALATLRSERDGEGATKQSKLWNSGKQPLFPSSLDSENRDNFSLGFGDHFSCRRLEPIPLFANENTNEMTQTKRRKRKRAICPEAKRMLTDLVRDHNVSSFVVSWPVQEDTGLMGASCGRTLWALEQLLEEETPAFDPNRPLCLWHKADAQDESETDPFGRSSVFARTSDKKEYYASKEQYHLEDEPVVAAEVWMDFMEHHWPAAGQASIPMGNVPPKPSGNSGTPPINPVDSDYNSGFILGGRRTLVAA